VTRATRIVHEPQVDSSICYETRVPHAGKMPARLNVGAKSRRRPNAAFALFLRTLGLLTAADVAGLRGIFPVHNGVLHTGFSANARHRLLRS
jgi:hypothetical protein